METRDSKKPTRELYKYKIPTILLVCFLSIMHALEFGSMGQVSASIGNAGVAVKNSAWAVYYNPALLGADRRSKIAYSFGAQFQETNILEVATLDFKTLANSSEILGNKLMGKDTKGLTKAVLHANIDVGSLGSLGDIFTQMGIKNNNGTITDNDLKNWVKQDLGCQNCDNNNNASVSEVVKNLQQNSDALNKFQQKLTTAADSVGNPLISSIIKNTDPKALVGLVAGVADGNTDPAKLTQEILKIAGESGIVLAKGADPDIDNIINAFNALNKTIQKNDLMLTSQNGIVFQIGGREPTKRIEVDNIGAITLRDPDNGRGAIAVGVFAQAFAGASANISKTHNRLIIGVGCDMKDSSSYDQCNFIEAKINADNITLSFIGTPNQQPPQQNQVGKDTFLNHSVLSPNAKHELNATALALIEIPVGYGHTFFTNVGDISAGLNFKFIRAFGYTFKEEINYAKSQITMPKIDDIISTQTFGVDLGILYTPIFAKRFNLGLVIKNLNTPVIKTNKNSIELNRQLRTGISYELSKSLTLALDYDLLPNDTLSTVNPQSQMLGGGILMNLKYIDFRVGAMKDLEIADNGVILTGGFNLLGFLDIALQYGLGNVVKLYGFPVSSYMALKVGGQFSW